MVSETVSLLLSAIAVLLSVVSLRRQRLPSRYKTERRIKEKFEQTSPLLESSANLNDGNPPVKYELGRVTILPYKGLRHRLHELLSGDLSARAELVLRTNDGSITKLEGDIEEQLKMIDGIRDAAVVTGDGISSIAIKLQLRTIDPNEVASIAARVMYNEMPKHIRTRAAARLK